MNTYKAAEVDRMLKSQTERSISRTRDWHACFGEHSALGCDGCDWYWQCFELSGIGGMLWREGLPKDYFKGLLVIVEETE